MKKVFKENKDNYAIPITLYNAGIFFEEGIYICKNCGQKLFLSRGEKLPVCSRCGHSVFTKQ